MAKEVLDEKPLASTESPLAEAPAPQPATRAPQPLAQPILDASKALCSYSNFCRVTGTPEEVVMDLGLNDNPMAAPANPIFVTQRVVLNYFTAKRLLQALHLTIQRHEAAFGVLEVDVQKRLTPRARQATG